MKPNDKLAFLLAEIDKLVNRYKVESLRYKKNAFRLRIVSVLLAALITILLGLKFKDVEFSHIFTNISLVLGAAITVISAYEAFFDPRALWVRETVTFVRLKDLKRDIEFWRTGKDPEDIDLEKLESYKNKLDNILDDTLKYWMKIRGAPELEKKLESRAELSANPTADAV
jgi:hypothetical protein